MSPVERKMVMRFLKKKAVAPVVMLFAEPSRGLDLAKRIARRRRMEERRRYVAWMMTDFCSQRKGSAGNGGETKSTEASPGSPGVAKDRLAGAGCKPICPKCDDTKWVPLGLYGCQIACTCREEISN